MRKILNDTPGPYSDFLLSEIAFRRSKKKNKVIVKGNHK